jgi:hypothetical protein
MRWSHAKQWLRHDGCTTSRGESAATRIAHAATHHPAFDDFLLDNRCASKYTFVKRKLQVKRRGRAVRFARVDARRRNDDERRGICRWFKNNQGDER